MHKAVKQALLRFGGYAAARAVYDRIETATLIRRVRRLGASGDCPLPDEVMLEPTLRCNMACAMCWQNRAGMAAGAELPIEEFAAFLDSNPRIRKVTLIGGEPFVRPDTIELIRHLDRTRDLVICTNGTLLGEAEWEAIASCRRIRSVCVSLDGPREIHEAVRRTPGSYERTTRTIRALAPRVPVTVNAVLQAANVGVLETLVEICAGLGVRKVKLELERLHTPERVKATREELGLVPAEIPSISHGRARDTAASALRAAVEGAVHRGRELGVYVQPDPPYLMKHVDSCHENRFRSEQPLCLCRGCRAATVAPDGSLIHCLNLRKLFGNIAEASLAELWHGADARGFRRRLAANNLSPLCEGCPFLVPVA